MAALKLKTLLEKHTISQRALAQAVGISPAAMTQLATHARWPKRITRKDIEARAVRFLGEAGVPAEELATAFERINAKATVAKDQDKEDSTMLLRRQGLFPATKQHFGLFRDPFTDDVGCHEDVYLSGDIRY